jgi:hypothetical protein
MPDRWPCPARPTPQNRGDGLSWPHPHPIGHQIPGRRPPTQPGRPDQSPTNDAIASNGESGFKSGRVTAGDIVVDYDGDRLEVHGTSRYAAPSAQERELARWRRRGTIEKREANGADVRLGVPNAHWFGKNGAPGIDVGRAVPGIAV